MLITYELTDGRHITGDEKDILVVHPGIRLEINAWDIVEDALKNGKCVINLAHVTHMHAPTDTDLDRYKVLGY